jgi:hypothetical protein
MTRMPGIANRAQDVSRESDAAQWERERQGRVDAYAAVLAHLNAAAAVVPMGDSVGVKVRGEIEYLTHHARGSLRRVLDEPNPYVIAEPTLREAATSILRDAKKVGMGDWDSARMAEFWTGIFDRTRLAALARMIDNVRGEMPEEER